MTKTRLAPKGGISQILDSSIELIYAIKKIHKKAPNDDINIFLMLSDRNYVSYLYRLTLLIFL